MKNIVFDLGNVLLRFYPEEYLSQHFCKEIYEELMIIIFCSDEWVQLDLGHLLIDDVIDIFNKRYPKYQKEMTFTLKNWTDMLIPIKENVEVLKECQQKGYSLYVLSNFHKEAIFTMKEKYDFFSLFDGGIISGFEHVIKPDKKIYELLFERYHLDPKESLFIDDSLANIETAKHLGMNGIHLRFDTNLKEELKKLKIL